MLRHGLLTEQQAQEKEQEWRESLKTRDSQSLEQGIRLLEKNRDRAANRNRQEAVGDLDYELGAFRAELGQRE
jgi:hypothetical protein